MWTVDKEGKTQCVFRVIYFSLTFLSLHVHPVLASRNRTPIGRKRYNSSVSGDDEGRNNKEERDCVQLQ